MVLERTEKQSKFLVLDRERLNTFDCEGLKKEDLAYLFFLPPFSTFPTPHSYLPCLAWSIVRKVQEFTAISGDTPQIRRNFDKSGSSINTPWINSVVFSVKGGGVVMERGLDKKAAT